MLDPAVAVTTAALMSLVLLVLLGSLLRSGMPGVREWFAANLGIVVALPLILMRGSIPDSLSVVIARGFYFMTLDGASNPVMFASAGSVMLLVAATAIMPTLSMSAMMMVHNVLLADARDAANRDFLTGALSRKGFEAVARTRLEEADRHGLPVSLLIVDLDHFKSINDTFGHAGGDTVLREFVRVAHLQLRRSDALGRLGGEEFAVLLPATQPDDAWQFAERLRQAVAAQPVTTVAGPCAYSISGGLAGWMTGETLDRLSARSDLALYDAKRAGRDRICAHQPVTNAAAQPPRDSAEHALAR